MGKILTILLVLISGIKCYAQSADYEFIDAEVTSPKSVKITLKTFAQTKKTVNFEAQCAALKIIMFDGIDGTIYSRPLLNQGTMLINDRNDYFYELFGSRLSTFIRQTKMESDFKKAEKGEKSTLFTVDVNYISLKKDLEKNNIKTQLGL